MKTIALTKGLVTLVDDADFDFLNQWKWHACQCNGRFYARRDVTVFGRKKKIYMHRLVSGAAPGQYPDHRDGCTLNNQRWNLRLGTQRQNMGNCGMQSHNTSGFKGVSWDKNRAKWQAGIKTASGRKAIGRFADKTEAARAYDKAAIEQFGEFARTNASMGLLQ